MHVLLSHFNSLYIGKKIKNTMINLFFLEQVKKPQIQLNDVLLKVNGKPIIENLHANNFDFKCSSEKLKECADECSEQCNSFILLNCFDTSNGA